MEVFRDTAVGKIRARLSDLEIYVESSYRTNTPAQYVGLELRTDGGDWQVWAVAELTQVLKPGTAAYKDAEGLYLDLQLLASFPGCFWGDERAEVMAKRFFGTVVEFMCSKPEGTPW